MTYRTASALRADNATPDEIRANLSAARIEAKILLDRAGRNERDLLKSEARDFERHMTAAGDLQTLLEDTTARHAAEFLAAKAEADERDREVAASRDRLGIRVLSNDGNRPTTGANRIGAVLHRALAGGSGSGAPFAPTEYGPALDYLRAKSVIMSSGARILTTSNRSLSLPHITAGTTAGWYAENAAITASDISAETITVTPSSIKTLEYVSNELRSDSEPNVAVLDMIARSMLEDVALKADLGFIEGTGSSNQPTGLKNVSGITTQTSGTNGATANLDSIVTAIGTLRTNNAEPTAIICHPRTAATLMALKDTAGRYLALGAGDPIATGVRPSLFGIPLLTTSQTSITETAGSSSDCSSIYVVQADQIVVVMRTDTPLYETDTSSGFASDQTAARCVLRVGIAVPNPTAVVRISGVRP